MLTSVGLLPVAVAGHNIRELLAGAYDMLISQGAGYPYAGKTMDQISRCTEEGVLRVHSKVGIPNNEIHIDEINEFTMGQLIYFFEMSAALSAYAMGLNPFDQPGVESYKKEMHHLVEEL